MRSLLCVILIIGFAFAQNSQSRIQLTTLNLIQNSLASTTTHAEYVDSANETIANNACRAYFHTITNVRQTSNSGTYFSVDIINSGNQELDFTLGLPNQGETFNVIEALDDGLSFGSDATCPPLGSCSFHYYCDEYPPTGSLEVNINTPLGSTSTETTSYNITVTQYTETVSTIGASRVFSQISPIGQTFSGANLGPENFVHFYHDLDLQVEELVGSGTFYVTIDNIVGVTTGTGYVCVSFDSLVGSTLDDVAVSANIPNPDGSLPQGTQATQTTNPCTIYCGEGDVSQGIIYVGLDMNLLCPEDELWIGVRLPGQATFDVNILVNPLSVASVTRITNSENEFQSSLDDACDIATGDFSCADYYHLIVSQTNFNLNSDPRLGPFLDIELYGASNGEFTVYVSDFLEGSAQACNSLASQCSITNQIDDEDAAASCHLVFCDLDVTQDYVITVENDNLDDSDFTADYGLHVNLLSWPLTDMGNLATPQVLFGEVEPGHYVHYMLTLTENDIFDDSYLEAEMTPKDPVSDEISFGWNFGDLAGESPCYSNRGVCTTETSFDNGNYDSPNYRNNAVTFCRFLFLACPISEYVDVYNSPYDYSADYSSGPNGEKVSELKPGTYYFAVWQSSLQSYNIYAGVKYTLEFNLVRSLPLYESLPTPSHVYFRDYSRQFVLAIPDDPSISTINVAVENVNNGVGRFYAHCGAPAGNCPCWNYDDYCTARAIDYRDYFGYFSENTIGNNIFVDHYGYDAIIGRCDLVVSRCSCTSNSLYISAQGIYPGGVPSGIRYNDRADGSFYAPFGFNPEQPIYFTLNAVYNVLTEIDEVEVISASRAGTTVADTISITDAIPISLPFFFGGLSTATKTQRYYAISLENVLVSENDALFVSLAGASVKPRNDAWNYYHRSGPNGQNWDAADVHALLALQLQDDFIPHIFSDARRNIGRENSVFDGCEPDLCFALLNLPLNFNGGRGGPAVEEPVVTRDIYNDPPPRNVDYEGFGSFGTCTLSYLPCSDGCFNRKPSFSSDGKYYLSVTDITETDYDYFGNFFKSFHDVYFEITVQIVDQSPKVLTDGLQFYSGVLPGEYLHFTFDATGRSPNSKVTFELYTDNSKVGDGLRFFFNYNEADADPIVYAGEPEDCYNHMWCDVCELQGSDRNHCSYTIPPCDLAGQTGTYYLSVWRTAFFFNPDFYLYDDYDSYDNYFAGYRKHFNFATTPDRLFFTITGRIEPLTPLTLGTSYIGTILAERDQAFYSVTVPSTTSQIIARILNVRVTVASFTDRTFGILISDNQPENECTNCQYGLAFSADSDPNFRHFRALPCERFDANQNQISTYYLSFTLEDDDDDNTGVDFEIHAFTEDVTRQTVSLTTQNPVVNRVNALYNNTTPLVVGSREITVVQFQLNAAAGEFFSVEVDTDLPLSGPGSRPLDVYITQGDYFLPFSSGSYEQFLDVDDQCISADRQCIDVSDSNRCLEVFEPCETPNSSTQWFITLSGDPLPLKTETANINIRIRKYAAQAVVVVPDSITFTPVPTNLASLTDVDVGLYSFTTSSNLGLAGGEGLTFQIDTAVSFYVHIGSETDSSCDITCEDSTGTGTPGPLSCSVYACDAITARTWYFFVETNEQVINTPTFTVTRLPSSVSTLSTITLNQNQVFDQPAQTGGTGHETEFQYFTFSVPSSSISVPQQTARYQLYVDGSTVPNSDIFYVDSPTFLPGFTTSGTDVVLFNSLSTSSTCGAATGPLPAEDCCFSAKTHTFAVRGNTNQISLEYGFRTFLGTYQSISPSGGTVSGTISADDRVNMIPFTVPTANNIHVDFQVTNGSATITMNIGNVAGTGDAAGSDTPIDGRNPGYCWPSDDKFEFDFCAGPISAPSGCYGTLPPCYRDCLEPQTGDTTSYTFAVTGTAGSTYTLTINNYPAAEQLNLGTNAERLPPSASFSGILNDDTTSSDEFALYSQYFYSQPAAQTINTIVPTVDPLLTNLDEYPRVTFVLTNFRDSAGVLVSADDLDIFINNNDPAGDSANSHCYDGDDIRLAHSNLPCLETPVTGEASANSTTVVCSIDACALSCTDVYFSVSRATATTERYSYDISVTNNYNDQVNSNQVQFLDLSLSSGIQTISRSNSTPNQDTAVYVRVRSSGIRAGQFTQFSVTPVSADVSTEILVETVEDLSFNKVCGGSLNTLCSDIDMSEECVWQTDPCTAEYDSIDPEFISYFRITRTNGASSWGFTFTANTINITPLDQLATTLSVNNPVYTATKEIQDFSWHFYEFQINTNDGYSYLSVEVNSLRCSTGVDLNVFTSFGQLSDDDEYNDVVINNQWPSFTCNLGSDSTTDYISDFMDTCEFNAGKYRVAIFAELGTQQFPDPSVLVAPVPALYDISATLVTLPHIVMEGCSLTQVDDSSFVSRIEIPIPATNRGAYLEFIVAVEGPGSVNAYFSNIGAPWGSNFGSTCMFNDDFDMADQSCSASNNNPCVIPWSPCAFSDGRYFVFLESSGSNGLVTVSYSLLSPYIPVLDVVALANQVLSYKEVRPEYTYYRLDSSVDFILNINNIPCNGFSCGIEFELYDDFRTHGYGNGDHSTRDCSDCDDDYDTQFLFSGDQWIGAIPMCSLGIEHMFMGVHTLQKNYDCQYEITMTPANTLPVVDLLPAEHVCPKGSDTLQLYRIRNVQPTDFIDIEFDDLVSVEDYNVYLGSSVDCFDLGEFSFPSSISFSGCDYAGDLYVLVVFEVEDCFDEEDFLVISYEVSSESVQIGTTGTNSFNGADFISITPSSFLAVEEGSAAQINSICEEPSCYSVLSPSVTYYFPAFLNPDTLTFTPISTPLLSTTAQTVTLSPGSNQVWFALPLSRRFTDAIIEDIAYSPQDFAENTDITFSYRRSTSPQYSGGCLSCGGASTSPCGDNAAYLPIGMDDCDIFEQHYVSISVCAPFTCDITFSIRVTSDPSPAVSVSGGTHNSAYTLISNLDSGCTRADNTFEYIFSASDILMVSIRQPKAASPQPSLTATSELFNCNNYYQCSVSDTRGGLESTCALPNVDDCDSTTSCIGGDENWRLRIELQGPGTLEFQIITDYVDFTSSTSGVIRGQTGHFYRLTNAASALNIELTVTSGPFLDFIVHDGCDGPGFYERQTCYFGTCNTYLPTRAKHSDVSEFYIVLHSSTTDYNGGNGVGLETRDFYNPSSNVDNVKDTVYSINVVKSTANCGAPPSSGFCADSSALGVNVWAEVSNSVWSFDDPLGQDATAECLYNELIQRCVAPSNACKQWLKTFACVTKFPQCDSNGFQMGVCQDLCLQVEDVCGPFITTKATDKLLSEEEGEIIFDVFRNLDERNVDERNVGERNIGEFVEDVFLFYQCQSNQYVRGANGTCYNNLPVNVPPPPPVDPLSFFNDDDNDGPGEYGLPFYLDVPVFDTIYATIPPIVNDDDDLPGGNKEQVFVKSLAEENSSTTFTSYFIFVILFVALLI